MNHLEHRYLDDPVHREEAGTPAIIESIRAGLVFQLKDAVGCERIRTLEHDFIRRAVARWRTNPHMQILGNPEAWRLSIVSFVVKHGERRWLHHNFVVALLNDLFGIQARGGCSCAGPYGHRLLGIDLATSRAFEREILRGCEGIKPGWVRVNFNYFLSERVFEYILGAVELIAEHGWRLLPDYVFDPETGVWRHRGGRRSPVGRLTQITYESGRLEFPARHFTEPESALRRYLEEGREILLGGAAHPGGATARTDDFEGLRWFPLPDDAMAVR